jgi:hypothetical protein
VVGRRAGDECARCKSADHRSLLGGEFSRERPMGISVAGSGGFEGVATESQRAADLANGLPSEAASAGRKERR